MNGQRRILLTLIMVVSTLVATAGVVDSLRQVVARAQGDDKSEAYKQLVNEMKNDDDADQLMALIDEWIDFENGRGNSEGEGSARWSKIAILDNFALDDQMQQEAPKQMEWFLAHKQWERYYNTWDSKANIYLYTGHAQTALHEATLMLKDAQERGQDIGRVMSYQLSGIIYESMGQYSQAIDALQKAVDLLSSIDQDSAILTNLYDYLSQTLGEKKDYERELKVTDDWMKAIERRRQKNDGSKKSLTGTTIACLVQRADAFTGLGRHDEAEQALRQACDYKEQVSTPLTTYRIVLGQARLAHAQGDNVKALERVDSLVDMGLSVGGDIGMLRANILIELKQFEEAATLLRDCYNEKDSVFNRDMRTQLDELTTLYHIDELEMRNRLDRSRLMIIILKFPTF